MSTNSDTFPTGEPSSAPPFQTTHSHLPTPTFTGGGSHHHYPHPLPPPHHHYHPATDANPYFSAASASSLPSGIGGGMGDVNGRPSHSSCSGRAITPQLAAPGYSLREFGGFREMAEYMSRDGDCALVRRFGNLRFRDLLCKQAQVAEIEKRLADADGVVLLRSGNVEMVRELMKDLDHKLKAYDDALDRCHRVFAMPRPSKVNVSKTKSWLRTRQFEWYLSGDIDDVVTLNRALITRVAALIARVVFKKEVTNRTGVDQLQTDRMILISRVLVCFIAPVILLVPVVLLCYVKRLWVQIVVLAVATVLSSLAMVVAEARNAEVIMATSAYVAVMVVFLGSVADVGGSGKG